MKISPYQKALLWALLVLLLYMFLMASISIFITHSEQPAVFGALSMFFGMSASMISIGLIQIRAARSRGEPKAWYQQYEIPLGLCILCIIGLLLGITIADLFPRTLLRIRVENTILLLISISAVIFIFLGLKYRPVYDQEEQREMTRRMLAHIRAFQSSLLDWLHRRKNW